MHRRVYNYFEHASKLAVSKFNERAYLFGGVGLRNDGTQVQAINSPTEYPNRKAHVEYKLCQKLNQNAVIYIARIRLLDGAFAIARPCADCRKILKSKKVAKVFYTLSSDSYGVFYPQTGKDVIYGP